MAGQNWRVGWPEEVVKEFVNEQVNYYGYDVSPEESREATSPWKQWLWLEKHGYDFAHLSIARQIFAFRIREQRPGVSLAEERELLLTIRGVMRRILKLPVITAEEREDFISHIPVSNLSHWSYVRRHYGVEEANLDDDFSDLFEFAWNWMCRDRPRYVQTLREIFRYDPGSPEAFCDDFTINGDYTLYLSPSHKIEMCGQVTGSFISQTYDMFMAQGNFRLVDGVRLKFVDFVKLKVAAA